MNQWVKLYNIENEVYTHGIMMDDGNVICMCCGCTIEAEDIAVSVSTEEAKEKGFAYRLIESFDDWVDLSRQIGNYLDVVSMKIHSPEAVNCN